MIIQKILKTCFWFSVFIFFFKIEIYYTMKLYICIQTYKNIFFCILKRLINNILFSAEVLSTYFVLAVFLVITLCLSCFCLVSVLFLSCFCIVSALCPPCVRISFYGIPPVWKNVDCSPTAVYLLNTYHILVIFHITPWLKFWKNTKILHYN